MSLNEAELGFVEQTVERIGRSPQAVIPILQALQEHFHYLPKPALERVCELTDIRPAGLWGIATFYDQFRFVPEGKIHIRICNGTSCFMNGSQAVINKFREELKIEPGQTTRNGNFSFEVVTCMGGCHHGPVIMVNGDYQTHVRYEQVPELIRRLKYIIEND